MFPLFWWIICAFLLNLSFWSRVTSLPFSKLVLGILILASTAFIYSHMGPTLASYLDLLTVVLVFPFQFAFLVCFPYPNTTSVFLTIMITWQQFPRFLQWLRREEKNKQNHQITTKLYLWVIPILGNNDITTTNSATNNGSNGHRKCSQQVKFSIHFLNHYSTCSNQVRTFSSTDSPSNVRETSNNTIHLY